MLQTLTQIELAIIVFITQIMFIWIRTINVVYISKLLILPSILTCIGLGISGLVAISIGVNALIDFQPLPIIGHVLGGVIGTWVGLIIEKKKIAKELLKKKKSIYLEKKEMPNYIL